MVSDDDFLSSEISLSLSSCLLYSSSLEACARFLAAGVADVSSFINLKSRSSLFQSSRHRQLNTLSGRDAPKLLVSSVPSFEPIELSGDSIRASFMGRLFVNLKGLDSCPLHILSFPLFLSLSALPLAQSSSRFWHLIFIFTAICSIFFSILSSGWFLFCHRYSILFVAL
jgi:hypothetical protein